MRQSPVRALSEADPIVTMPSAGPSIPVVTGTPLAEPQSAARVPVGIPADTDTDREAVVQAKARFRADLEEIARRQRREFQVAVDLATGVAQARVGESVQSSIHARLPGALQAHLQDSAATQQLVAEVGQTLQRHVEADAASVVARLASREVASRELSAAIEARAMARVDEGMRSLWAAWFLGGAVTAGAVWLFGAGGRVQRREP